MEKTLRKLTLSDLVSSDCHVWLSKNEKFGFDIEIESEDQGEFSERGLHPMCAEGLADFCERYLRIYKRLNQQGDN